MSPAFVRVSKRIPKGIGAYPVAKRSDIEARVASSKSKIFIFRIEGEQPHQHLLRAARRRAGLRPVDEKAM
jgi:hypothetical protein